MNTIKTIPATLYSLIKLKRGMDYKIFAIYLTISRCTSRKVFYFLADMSEYELQSALNSSNFGKGAGL